jgi:hypothetical protein
MSGLSAFRLSAVPAPTPTAPKVYNGSYATTQADAQAKCEGNNVASVTRSATSTESLVAAILAAKNLAIAALVCPIFTGSYTTTPEDYIARCGQGTQGASVTRSATSGKDPATATASAKQAALDAIVCPVPLPTLNTPVSPGETKDVVFYDGLPNTRFWMNLPLPAGDPSPAQMGLFFRGVAQGNVQFNGNLVGLPCALEIEGELHYTTFQNTDTVDLS